MTRAHILEIENARLPVVLRRDASIIGIKMVRVMVIAQKYIHIIFTYRMILLTYPSPAY